MGADERNGRNEGRGQAARPHGLGDALSGTNLERAGDHNQRVTLQAVRAAVEPITRAEIAELTGLTAPAIANITKRLLNDGMILKAGRHLGGRGQPATKLVVNPDGAFSLNLLFDKAAEAERLFGVRMDGLWLHVGTPEAIGEAELSIADSAA